MPRPFYMQVIRRERHPFQPDHLPGLRIWVAAHRIDGLVDNDPITTAPDLSGLGNDFAQSVVASKPLFKTDIVNGYPVMRFDQIDDYLESPYAASDETADSQAFFAVFHTFGVSSFQMLLWAGDGASGGFGGGSEIHMGIGDLFVSQAQLNAYLGNLTPNPGSNIAFNDAVSFHTLGAQFAGLTTNSPTVQVFADGVGGPIVTGSAAELVTWSGVTRMGRPGAATRFFAGDVAEACVFNAAGWGDKTLINHAKLAGYAKAKYALTT